MFDPSDDFQGALSRQTFESKVNGALAYGFDLNTVFEATPGPHTYELEVWVDYRVSTANAATFYISEFSSLIAVTIPFGPNGDGELNPL